MMEEDLLLEEQIKKKKRLVLLLLLTLLLIVAGAAAIVEPAATPPTAIAGVTTPSLATPAVNTPSPHVQGDEWTAPLTPSPEDKPGTAMAIVSTATTAASRTPPPTQTKNQAEIEASLTPIPDPPREITVDPSATISPVEDTSVTKPPPTAMVETSVPTVSSKSSTEVAQNLTAVPPTAASPAATEISKRINESWEVLDGYVSISGNEVNVFKPGAVTSALTGTTTLSETTVMIPPNGLPVTGTMTPRKMNWTALVVVVLLIGSGAIALIYPKIVDN